MVYMMITGLLAVVFCLLWEKRSSDRTKADPRNVSPTDTQAREREAHYMRNFWNYDGSEQQEWDA